jgi:hypothetical protein
MPAPPRYALIRRPNLRRWTCALLLVAFVVSAVGIPLPAGDRLDRYEKSGGPFPCAKSACGCRTARQCWQSCCCHTFSERLAWARRNGVRPPDFGIAKAKAARLDLSWVKNGSATFANRSNNCCEARAVQSSPTCCKTGNLVKQANNTHSCCSLESSPANDQAEPTNVIAWQAFECNGHSFHWLAAVPTLFVNRVDFSIELPNNSILGPATSDRAITIAILPAVPPPERV